MTDCGKALQGDESMEKYSQEIIRCKDCVKMWTKACPIRVWGRVEEQEGQRLDVNPDKDYCSSFMRTEKIGDYKMKLEYYDKSWRSFPINEVDNGKT